MRRLALVLPVTVLLVACSDSPMPPPGASQVAVAEPSWDEQIADLQAGRSTEIHLSSHSVGSDEFRALELGCEELTALVLDRAALQDGDLAVLASLPRLRWLKLPGVGDEGMFYLSRCRALEILNLPDGRFTDAGLAHVAKLDRLSLLRFASPNVTDDGLAVLGRLPRLRFLHLIDVPTSDAGLKHVAAVPTLESFYLDGGRTTDVGLHDLLISRPDLHFHKDQRHLPGDPNAHHE